MTICYIDVIDLSSKIQTIGDRDNLASSSVAKTTPILETLGYSKYVYKNWNPSLNTKFKKLVKFFSECMTMCFRFVCRLYQSK